MFFRNNDHTSLSRVAELEREWSSAPWSETALADFLTDSCAHLLTAHEGDTLLGYATWRGVLDAAELVNIAVSPAARCGGVGRKLLCRLIEDARESGIETITLEVRATNRAARALYESAGFVSCGVRKHFYTHPDEDGIIYVHTRKGQDAL